MELLPLIAVDGVTYIVDRAHSQMLPAETSHPIIPLPRLKLQEIPYDAEASNCRFVASSHKPSVMTPAARDAYGLEDICGCLVILKELAEEHDGLDYLQVFEDATKPEPLWFIEDGDGGAITALLPSDY